MHMMMVTIVSVIYVFVSVHCSIYPYDRVESVRRQIQKSNIQTAINATKKKTHFKLKFNQVSKYPNGIPWIC